MPFLGGVNPLVPVGATGLTFIIIFTILSRVGSIGMSAMASSRMPNMKQFENMPFFNAMQGQSQSAVPENLPNDITRTQYVILKQYRNGVGNPKEVAKRLSMDKKEVEKETAALKTNGYLTKKTKLTTKSMELLT